MKSEIENRANFNQIRYSQCWEDADILLEALNIKETDNILSVASAGDNSFAMLINNPNHVLAVDLSFEQIACCELRKVCYKYMEYNEFLDFSGVLSKKPHHENRRLKTYFKYNQYLPKDVAIFWDNHLDWIQQGFMTVGKFENYFRIFRDNVMPLVHSQKTIYELLKDKSVRSQKRFYKEKWNSLRWKGMFKIFFSEKVMGKLGRDPEFYKYVSVSAADKILERATHALTNISTHKNPYLNYILLGRYRNYLPTALRWENFEKIKKNIDKIEFKQISIESALKESNTKFDCYNLSDIFEYMSQESMDNIYKDIINYSNKGARIAYWNMLVDRKCQIPNAVEYDKEYCKELLLKDKAFFYSDFVLEKIK